MNISHKRQQQVVPLSQALVGGFVAGGLVPILYLNLFSMGGSSLNLHFLPRLAAVAIVVAGLVQLGLGRSWRPDRAVIHLLGSAGGLGCTFLLLEMWPRVARERSEFLASYAPRIVDGAILVQTAFTIIWLSVAVAVALSFSITLAKQGLSKPKNG